ncbi:hypothetical protein MMC12_004094 [Toensbergia leucococca]|nr:hypothetical protein [Toensbergia leucococca]
MPGSFSTDNSFPPKLDIEYDAQSLIFQPPKTPSASSSLYRSTALPSTQVSSNSISRKRSRHASISSDQALSYYPTLNAWLPMASGSYSAAPSPGTMSPASFVNTKYRLAGGLDTPTADMGSSLEKKYAYGDTSDFAFRRGAGWSHSGSTGSDSYFSRIPSALAREGNGLERGFNQSMPHDGWGKAVCTVGQKLGKLWQFCRENAFRGFYAGGGRGYRMEVHSQQNIDVGSLWQAVDEKDDVFQSNQRGTTSAPGCYPDEDLIPDYMSGSYLTPPRAAKKIQREKGEGSLHASWVMINNLPSPRETSPNRTLTRKILSSGSPGVRPNSKAGRRILPACRPSLTSYAGSPALRSGQPASFASPRSPRAESPLSAETQRYAARIRRRQKEDDVNLKRFNQQLKAMIREGKEALGTKFEVEEVMDGLVDEGYAEGE